MRRPAVLSSFVFLTILKVTTLKHFKMNTREIILILMLAVCALIISGFIPNKTYVVHSSVMGCELGCDVAGAGYPFPYIADKPYLSPTGSADAIGALIGDDQIFPIWMIVDFVILTLVFYAVLACSWHLIERISHGAGHSWLFVFSKIFSAFLLVCAVNILFLVLGVVTGMLFIPYYWIVLLLSAAFMVWRTYKSVQERPDLL